MIVIGRNQRDRPDIWSHVLVACALQVSVNNIHWISSLNIGHMTRPRGARRIAGNATKLDLSATVRVIWTNAEKWEQQLRKYQIVP